MNRLSALDALFLYAEDGTSHMHIGSCAVFDGPAPTHRQLARWIDGRLHLVPRFRQRVQFVPGHLGRPIWIDDDTFDLDRHLRSRRLERPGDDEALWALVAALMSDELDRDHALWQMTMVTGLASGRWALVTKAHHCMVDGVSGTDLMSALLDDQRSPVTTERPRWTPAPPPSAAELVTGALRANAGDAATAVRAVGRCVRAPRRAWETSAGAATGLLEFARHLARPDRGVPVDGHLDADRTFAVARCELADVRDIRRTLGGSVNDVVLSVVAGAMREVMADGVSPGTTVSCLVPVSIRAADDRTANNQVSLIIAPLAVGVGDPVERLDVTRRNMAELKRSNEVAAGIATFTLANLVPAPLLAAGIRATETFMQQVSQRIVGTVATNVPGPRAPLYALGREMREYIPFVPLGPGVRVGIAILSYDGHLAFGVSGDGGTGRQVDRIATSIEDGMARLVELATTRGRTAS
ncbi:MAG: wax ester/triacylglycerol synthase family O-acyltransferase [Ilumatobacteraceae bacterium]